MSGTASLPEYVGGLPNICGAEDAIAQALARRGPLYLPDSGIDFGRFPPHACGVVIGSGIGGLNEFETQHATMMEKAFSSGKPLINGSDGRNFKVMGLRRHGPGEVEVHDRDTDIFYVVQGRATFVTGGTLTGGRHTAPDETRGGTLAGGETRHLAQGDVIVIPKAVPHWFKEVTGPFTYYVVKVR